jgi:hypothetical protein
MITYSIKSTPSTLFTLSQDDTNLGSLTYESWSSYQATIALNDGLTYAIQPKGFWGTTIEIKSGETVLFDFKMKWDGQIIIRKNANDTDAAFVVKYKSVVKNTFVLLGQHDDELLLIKPSFTWNKSGYDYQLTASATFEHLPDKALLLLIAVYCINYSLSIMLASTNIVIAS